MKKTHLYYKNYSPFATEKLPNLNFREILGELGGKAFSPVKSSCYPLAVWATSCERIAHHENAAESTSRGVPWAK